ncbi:putative component of NuA3 histone acetyltransferase complex [Gnomoniopsis smithogilvyi]|uniref:uS12 prolyl 3,4-dihydroxylase n=1 Tax=Gnomoniopsis smithogilvyi TaxID=1191159 RepID=A0A9W9D2D3_9PEZI|nr:putative component of NuA3 histone acetyltransferase complex [Gnomoniopsis smithogilvyi]
MMKRKAGNQAEPKKPLSKRAKSSLSADEAKARFRTGLFNQDELDKYTSGYAESSPYKHSVINGLIDDSLLRNVREEIRDNVSFTPKETDIYKIHQSGDLANLDGLEDEALAKLPSLLALRDAIYSEAFRNYVSHVTGCGPLSARKTDLAINVYTPGCYLLCHDDVIGSRKVSYILYLTDPDKPWQPEWGGALRLFPTSDRQGKDGAIAKTPGPDVVKIIPPAWNQLSFFAVQPGESFHDVEEVYHADTKEQLEKGGGRIRMAVSGWFHIPQAGEEGYVAGAEEEQAKNSSLMQLQGNPDQHDEPKAKIVPVEQAKTFDDFEESDIEFLLKYLAPTYLTPDTLEQMQEHFNENSSITLPNILSKKFSARLKDYVAKKEAEALPEQSDKIEKQTPWRVAKPPHKHRFLYFQPGQNNEDDSPIKELLEEFLPSPQFRAWLAMATDCKIESYDVLARRFRRGLDYTLATGHEGKPRLELNFGLTPTPGWGDDNDGDFDEEAEAEQNSKANGSKSKPKSKSKSKAKGKGKAPAPEEKEEPESVGGHEVYMAGDDEDDEDAAIYKASADDDNILFFQAASWNQLTMVLRDSGTLRFVKYVSRKAKGDRWDISASFDIEEGQSEDESENGGTGGVAPEEDSEEEFQGFSDHNDESESD